MTRETSHESMTRAGGQELNKLEGCLLLHLDYSALPRFYLFHRLEFRGMPTELPTLAKLRIWGRIIVVRGGEIAAEDMSTPSSP
jgi:hypothetical protein